jgi:hypothetical protein
MAAVRAILLERASIDARSTVTAQTGSADAYAASGTFAA